MSTEQEIAELVEVARLEVSGAADPEALEALRVKYLGRKGALTQVLRGLKDLDPETRRQVGAAANRAKESLEAALAEALTALKEAAARAAAPAIDVTLPGRRTPLGRLHPLTRTMEEICDIFLHLGALCYLLIHNFPKCTLEEDK